MSLLHDHSELYRFLKSTSGAEFLNCFSLVSSTIQSELLISLLKTWSVSELPAVEAGLRVPLSLIAFGSLGRLEFVVGRSDLDPVILVDGDGRDIDRNEIRTRVITRMAASHLWLDFDDRAAVLQSDWGEASAAGLRFPVITVSELINADSDLLKQRRWQVLLEGQCIYNDALFTRVRGNITPHSRKSAPLLGNTHGRVSPDFVALLRGAPEFFSAFENPQFLYKDAVKYWKTRFLREFFVFSCQISFVLGWYLEAAGEPVDDDWLRAPGILKLMRATRFAEVLDSNTRNSTKLDSHFADLIKAQLSRHQIDPSELVSFGQHIVSDSGRLLHAVLVCLVIRFTKCWEKMYDEGVCQLLAQIPKSQANFDAAFRQLNPNPEAQLIIDELMKRRDSYRKFMGAASGIINAVFVKGKLWSKDTILREVAEALAVFASSE